MKVLMRLRPSKQECTLPVIYRASVQSYTHFDPFALFITCSIILCLNFITYLGQGQLSDELFHIPMVQAILDNQWGNLPTNVTTPPYYHAFLAFFASLPGLEAYQLQTLRIVQLTLSALAIPILYQLSKKLRYSDCDVRTLMCLLLPIVLPFMGLVYTDTPALTLTIAMIACTLSTRHWLAAFFGVLGLGIRQITVIWACFCACWVILDFYFTHQKNFDEKLTFKKVLIQLTPKLIPYIILGGIFIFYLIINGGAVAGDKSAHSVSFNPSNIYVWLIISFFLFFPMNIEYAKENWDTLIKKRWLWVFIPIMLITYLYFFKITHVYNFGNTWWAHNKLLQFTTGNILIKILCFIPITWMAMSYIRAAIKSTWTLTLLLVFSVISFLPMPMVDFRYYMIAVCLFIVWKPTTSEFSNRVSLIMYLGATVYTLHATSMHWFFP
ncbi:hypothetical protein [Marinagarivorans algicola]|uniref:hypothetical protein n=1 Tax=Marinagarivorans algicola TaxID=1513270 RepID=UPI0006B94012|nr:hypothetical protein [Marinagarivorans algicola]